MVWKRVEIPPHRFVSQVFNHLSWLPFLGMALSSEDASRPLAVNLPSSLKPDLVELDSVICLQQLPLWRRRAWQWYTFWFRSNGCLQLAPPAQTEDSRNFHGTKRGVDLNKSYKLSMKVQGLVPLLFGVFGLDALGFIHFSATLSCPQERGRATLQRTNMFFHRFNLSRTKVTKAHNCHRVSSQILNKNCL